MWNRRHVKPSTSDSKEECEEETIPPLRKDDTHTHTHLLCTEGPLLSGSKGPHTSQLSL